MNVNDDNNYYAYYIKDNIYIKKFPNSLAYGSFISSFKVQDQSIEPFGKIDTFFFTPIFRVHINTNTEKINRIQCNSAQYFKCHSINNKYQYHYIEHTYYLNLDLTLKDSLVFRPDNYCDVKSNTKVYSEYDSNNFIITAYIPTKISFKKFCDILMHTRTYDEYMPKLKKIVVKELLKRREADYKTFTNIIKNAEEKEKWS